MTPSNLLVQDLTSYVGVDLDAVVYYVLRQGVRQPHLAATGNPFG
jgi:hypothetical protein